MNMIHGQLISDGVLWLMSTTVSFDSWPSWPSWPNWPSWSPRWIYRLTKSGSPSYFWKHSCLSGNYDWPWWWPVPRWIWCLACFAGTDPCDKLCCVSSLTSTPVVTDAKIEQLLLRFTTFWSGVMLTNLWQIFCNKEKYFAIKTKYFAANLAVSGVY